MQKFLKKIIVTGYNGFLGSHLVNKLSKKYEIIGISNNLSKLNNLQQVKKDVRRVTLRDIPKDIFCIVHLAALTDVVYCENNPTQCYNVNVTGTQNMLEIARKINSKFLYVSTSHVYGAPTKLPVSEDHPRNPTSIYATSKLVGEIISESYAKTYHMDISIARLFSIYGPKSPQHLVTSRIMQQLLTSNIIHLGNLKPKRDFVYVKDAVVAITILLKKLKGFNTYNIGTGKSYSILHILDLLKKISGKNIPIKSMDSQTRQNDIFDICADIYKIKKIGWQPETSIENGLKMTFNEFPTC